MKIAYGGYPLMQLLGSEAQKVTRGRAKNDSGPGDVTVLSVVPDKAVVKYLKAVEEIASEIMGITGSNVPLEDKEKVSPVLQGLLKLRAIVPGDALMFLPGGASSGLEKTTGSGELFLIKGAPSAWTEGQSEGPDENSLAGLTKDIAGRLSLLGAGMGMRTDSFDSPAAKEKFIIFVNGGKDNILATSAIRQERSGRVVFFDDEVTTSSGSGIPSLIEMLAASPTKELAERSGCPSPHYGVTSSGDVAGEREPVDINLNFKATVEPVMFLLTFNPVEKASEILSLIVAGRDGKQVLLRAQTKGLEALQPSWFSGLEGPAFLAGAFSGSTVVIVDQPTGDFSMIAADVATEVEGIVEKMVALSDAVNRLASAEVKIEGADADGSDRETAMRVPVKEAMNGMVKDSLRVAVSHKGPAATTDNTSLFGITVDEKGLLKLDREAFTKALVWKRDETVGFIRDFAGLLHNRITYNFNPFTASCIGGQENTGLRGPIQKEARANEGQDERTTFEKRLNELQMLLKNSYELKESFMKRKSVGRDGHDEESQ